MTALLRGLLLAVLIVCLSLPVEAQTLASGSITTNGQSISAGLLNAEVTGVSIQISGTWTGTITFQVSTDGSTFVSLLASDVTTGDAVATTTANGVFAISNSGYRTIRATATAAMTGTAVVSISQGFGAGGGGSSGGAVTNAGLTELAAAINSNLVDVNIVSGGSGGTQYTQDAALTVATSVGTMAMGRASATAPTDVSANNDAVLPWYLLSGASVTAPSFGGVVAVAGNGASGTGVQRVTVANDSTGILAGVTTVTTLTGGGIAAGAADSGNPLKVGGIYSSTLPTLDNGDRGNLQLTVGGALIVAPSLTGAFATDATHDSAALATGPQAMAVAAATGALPTAVTAGDAVRYAATLNGVAYTRTPDPCSDEALKVYFPVDIVTATTTEIVNASASNYFRLCSINLVSAGANNIAIVEDDTDACASPTAGLNGGVTAGEGWNIGSNGGMSVGSGMASVMKTAATNRYVCIITSAAVQLSGTVVYTLSP